MPADRGSEHGETGPRTVEQAIEETRPQRDAWRAENWSQADLVNQPDHSAWDQDPEPLTSDELARLENDQNPQPVETPPVEPSEATPEPPNVLEPTVEPTDHGAADTGGNRIDPAGPSTEIPHEYNVGKGRTPTELPAPTDDPRESGEAGAPPDRADGPTGEARTSGRITIVFSEGGSSLDPVSAGWSGWVRRDVGDQVDPTAGPKALEGPSDSAYRSPEDVREALLEGKSVKEVKQELADQPPAADESTTELYGTEGDLRFERPELSDDLDMGLENDRGSRGERFRKTMSDSGFIDNAKDASNSIVDKIEKLLDRPEPTGAFSGAADRPVIREAPRESLHGGELVIAAMLLGIGAHHVVRSGRTWWSERKHAGREGDDAGH